MVLQLLSIYNDNLLPSNLWRQYIQRNEPGPKFTSVSTVQIHPTSHVGGILTAFCQIIPTPLMQFIHSRVQRKALYIYIYIPAKHSNSQSLLVDCGSVLKPFVLKPLETTRNFSSTSYRLHTWKQSDDLQHFQFTSFGWTSEPDAIVGHKDLREIIEIKRFFTDDVEIILYLSDKSHPIPPYIFLVHLHKVRVWMSALINL